MKIEHKALEKERKIVGYRSPKGSCFWLFKFEGDTIFFNGDRVSNARLDRKKLAQRVDVEPIYEGDSVTITF